MPAPTSFDLATLDSWCGCRPGMTRTQVREALQIAGLEAEAYGQDNLTVTEDEWEMEFYFATDGSERLRQLSIDGNAIHWKGTPLMDLRVDEAVRTIHPAGPWLWTDYDVVGSPFPDPDEADAPPATDEALLLESTLWWPERGLGLIIYEGAIFGVAWRSAPDLPPRYAGPLTAAQRELSQRADLPSYLQEKHTHEITITQPKDPLRFARGAWTVAAIVAMALTARDGIREMFLWGEAPTVKAKVLAMERGPLKQFFEYLPQPIPRYLPQWLLAGKWSGLPPETDLFLVEFTDPQGQRHEARLESAEFYIAPREIGTEVEVVYAGGEPPRVKGPSRVRDAAFIEHIPWAISIGVLWLLGQIAIGVLPALWRLLRPLVGRAISPSRTIDPDRPELS